MSESRKGGTIPAETVPLQDRADRRSNHHRAATPCFLLRYTGTSSISLGSTMRAFRFARYFLASSYAFSRDRTIPPNG
jgi:hypothetical protein